MADKSEVVPSAWAATAQSIPLTPTYSPWLVSSKNVLRTLGRYGLTLALLTAPAIITLALKGYPRLYPFISFSFVLAVAMAGWWQGFWAGILVSAASGPVLMALVTGGKSILPPNLDPAALAVMVLISLLTSRVAAARKKVEKVLRSANSELESASRLKSEFLAHMSHELRTPLNAVIGYTGTLLMRLPGPLTAGQEKQLKTIQSSARHLLSLINDLLDMAKIEAGKLEIHNQTVSYQAVINDVVATLRPLAQAKNIELQANLPSEDVSAIADPRALTQIFINLANNGIKFTEKGSVRLDLREREDNGKVAVVIDVIDTGCGIRREDQARLFQAFKQIRADESKQEGTGLGLYLSGRLTALLGGRIEFESEYGKGSRFTVLIPKG
jgi:signal transduction histidine kinase